MSRRFRLFRSSWSLVLVLGAVLLTLAACEQPPTSESDTNTGDCSYNPTTHACT